MIVVTNNDRMGKNLKKLRCKHNLSQEALAQLIGISGCSLDAIERGKQLEIDTQVIDKICRHFGIGVSALMEDVL